MEDSLIQNLVITIEKCIKSYETEKFLEKKNNRNLGIIYTPKKIVDYIVSNIFRIYFDRFLSINNETKYKQNLEEIFISAIKNQKTKEILTNIIKNIKILDPSCGSGRFIISVAEKLYRLHRILEPRLSDFDLKKAIIENNLYGIEIEQSSILISKLRLIKWLLSTNINNFTFHTINFKSINLTDFNQIIELLDLNFNLFNLDFLLDFNYSKFSIITGNPPYIENKKIKNNEFKKRLTKRFNSAYRLYDLSILFIEKSLELLENNGCLSFILPNKFLSADFGIKIRELLLNQTKIREIINISSLPVFKNTAAYPIILSLKITKQNREQAIIIKIFNNMDDLFDDNRIQTIKFNQNLIHKIPAKVIPVSGNIEIINYLFRNFEILAKTFKDLKIMYRPFGFLKYNKYFANISDKPQSSKDLLLIGTGNIGKYHVKFKKRIKIAGNDIKISYFKYYSNLEQIWSDLNREKLIFREIAKELTCCYDPGVFTNITGLYFIKLASFNTDQLFGLLTVLNSSLMDSVFKTLFSTLHMAGGYLRFNGSYIKRLPMPRKFPAFLSQLGKYLQLLSQLKYDFDSYNLELISNTELDQLKNKYHYDLKKYLNFFTNLSNSLVTILYLDDFYMKYNLDYDILREMLDLKTEPQKVPQKFLIPKFHIENYKIFQINELDDILTKINTLYNQLHKNKHLLNQIGSILKNNFN